MMKLSHESKVRLGVGIGAFVLIIGLVFGTSRTLIHFDGPWDLDDVVPGLSGMDDMFDDDDLLDSGNYSARPQQLSSETFDADAQAQLGFMRELHHSSPSLAHGSAVAAVATSASTEAETF